MAPWWIDAVVYQIYPRSFADSDGDGTGDLRGILSKLDYLQDLGVDVLWLSPIYPSPQADNGYDISDYRGIDPMFGTLEDFDALLTDVHRRGMRLIMDLVVNHTSDEHPWFVDSRSSRDSPKRDWYWWRPASADGPPNNWGSIFSGSAWTLDEPTGEYFLHLFARKQPDLNWENPQVREAVYALMNWWLDRGVDGFRMDVINLVSKDPHLPDGQKLPGDLYGDGSPYFRNGPRLHEFLHEMWENTFAARDEKLAVGECHGTTVEMARLLTDQDRGELDMLFHFEHVEIDQARIKWLPREYTLPELKEIFARWQQGLADVGWNTLYWDNHDQPRVVSRFGDDGAYWYESATLLATVLHLHRGTPFIFQGEEIGMTNFPFTSIDQFHDVESLNYYTQSVEVRGRDPQVALSMITPMSRDNARTPMQWDDGPNAGFTKGTPWLAVNPNSDSINAAAQVDDPRSVLAHYKRLIALRHEDPVVQLGRFDLLLPDHPRLWAFTRSCEHSRLLVVANVGGEAIDCDVDMTGELVLTNYPDQAAQLRPWEVRVYRQELP